MTSHNASSIFASLEIGAVLLGLITWSIWQQLQAHWAEMKRRDDAGEVPYVRDKERAALIAQHPLLQMKKRGAE